MTTSTYKKLQRLGYSEEFIKSIIGFKKDSTKRFILRVTDIEDLSQPVREGEFICYASFSTLEELEEIIDKLEGFACEVMDMEEISLFREHGIIDDCTYEMFEDLIKGVD